jgi:hypothetical protein
MLYRYKLAYEPMRIVYRYRFIVDISPTNEEQLFEEYNIILPFNSEFRLSKDSI